MLEQKTVIKTYKIGIIAPRSFSDKNELHKVLAQNVKIVLLETSRKLQPQAFSPPNPWDVMGMGALFLCKMIFSMNACSP